MTKSPATRNGFVPISLSFRPKQLNFSLTIQGHAFAHEAVEPDVGPAAALGEPAASRPSVSSFTLGRGP